MEEECDSFISIDDEEEESENFSFDLGDVSEEDEVFGSDHALDVPEPSSPPDASNSCPPTQLVPEEAPQFGPLPKRIQSVKFALTYPQCETSMVQALAAINEKWEDNVKWCVVAEEKHADGSPHLHVALMLHSRIRVQGRHASSFFDFITGKHGNYQVMKDPYRWLRYVIKGGRYLSTPGFDPNAFLRSKTTKKGQQGELIARNILDGERDLYKLASEFPGYFISNLKKVEAFTQYVHLASLNRKTLSPLSFSDPPELSPPESLVFDWLRCICERRLDRANLHLRLEGPTGVGKSSFAFALRSFFRVWQMPYDTTFFCEWDDQRYDLVLLDEFRSQLTPTFINRFADGMGVQLNRKGAGPVTHSVKTPILLLSNYTLEECYPGVASKNPDVLRATARRFQTVLLGEGDNMFRLCDWLNAQAGDQ